MRVRMCVLAIGIAIAHGVETGRAQPAAPEVNDLEFKCMRATSRAGGKFWTNDIKCVGKCFNAFWNGDVPESDCLPPYGGFTAQCIDDTVSQRKGAEQKLALTMRKACDPTFKAGRDCPECYAFGDCSESGQTGGFVLIYGAVVDGFVPGFFCERAGAFELEARCQKTTARRVAQYVDRYMRCHERCFGLARKGLFAIADCVPPVLEPATLACIEKAAATASGYIHRDCDPPPASPDGCGAPYPTAEEWIELATIAAQGFVPSTYCTE